MNARFPYRGPPAKCRPVWTRPVARCVLRSHSSGSVCAGRGARPSAGSHRGVTDFAARHCRRNALHARDGGTAPQPVVEDAELHRGNGGAARCGRCEEPMLGTARCRTGRGGRGEGGEVGPARSPSAGSRTRRSEKAAHARLRGAWRQIGTDQWQGKERLSSEAGKRASPTDHPAAQAGRGWCSSCEAKRTTSIHRTRVG